MRSISVSAASVAGAAVSLMMATTTSLSAQQSDNPQTHPPVTVRVPSNPVAPTGKRSHANPSRLVVACSGAFAKDSSHLKLTMTYDLNNIDFGEVDASSGKTMASIVFPKDPKRRLEVWWSDPNKRKDTYLIVINGSSTWAGPKRIAPRSQPSGIGKAQWQAIQGQGLR